MSKSLKKCMALLLTLTLLVTTLLISPLTASATTMTPVSLEKYKISVWADPEEVLTQAYVDDFNDGTSVSSALGGIQPYQIEATAGLTVGSGGVGNYYLFLPSTADCSSLTLWLVSDSTLTIDGTEIESGVPTDIFAELDEGGISKDYTFTLDSTSYDVTVLKSGDVGTVYITTESGSLSSITSSQDNYEAGTIMVVQSDGTVDYMGDLAKMSGRGNGTWDSDNDKNPYNIKLASSTSLLGMSKAKKWCLLASTGSGNDATFVKNQLTYDFADYIGIEYQVHCKPVDLYVNQQYLGSYQLAEKVEIKSNRVDVTDAYENLEIANGTTDSVTGAIIPADLDGTEVVTTGETTAGSFIKYDLTGQTIGAYNSSPSLTNPSDSTGGYIYELEISNRWVNENAGFCAYNRQGWVIKSADYVSSDMLDYSYNLLYALGSSVYNGGTVPSESTTTTCSKISSSLSKYGGSSSHTVTNPAPEEEYQGMSWSDILDADSAVKYYWTQEFFKNMDSSTSSTYFYKDSDSVDGKLYAGPVWDMDNSLCYDESASRWGYSYTTSDGWYTKNARIYRWRCEDSTTTYSTDDYSPLNFYAALATNCSDFWAMAEDYWYSTISPAVDVLLGNTVDETGTLQSISEYVTTVTKSAVMDATRFSTTYDAESVISGLETWVSERQTWINDESGFSTTAISGTLVGSVDDYSYTGSEITPEPVVTYNDSVLGTITLTEGVDYTLSYSNNVNVGTATISITGINGYTGTKKTTFNIVANDLTNATLTIDSSQYADTSLTPTLTDADGNDLSDAVSYQWYKDGTAITDATDKTYAIAESDAGSEITVVATGDGTNIINSVTSNTCTILEGERPEGFTMTIASWDYDYTADSTALANADTSGGYYYDATGGELQSSAELYASVNATDEAEIKWSGSSDLYTNDSNSVTSDQAPVMGTSKTNSLAWGAYPYFETVVSTVGFEDICFTAKLGGTKKAPRDWKLQYSLDGTTYTDIDSATYSITDNKTMELAFSDIALPSDCDNQQTVYIRMIVTDDIAINGTNTIVNQTSGDAAVNNIAVTGTSLSVITELYAPTITSTDDGLLFDDNTVTITDNNGGADLYYTVNDGEAVLYTGEFNPFNASTAKIGDTAEISAYAYYNDITSEITTATVTFAGVNINSFVYSDYSTDVTAGAVQSTGGVYGQSGKMTAYADGTSQYVPLWNSDNGSFSVAPDDGLKWSEESGFTYQISTVGYENVSFSCTAYTTNYGPNSLTLQYSTDGVTYYNVESDVQLTANGTLEQLFSVASLPAACDNQRVVYIRLATTENLTYTGEELHDNYSKGNLYVNDVIISGEDDGTLKMPYTEKSTQYFGANGVIEYISPDGLPMRYVVLDSSGQTVGGGTYSSSGIQLSTVDGFDKSEQEAYTVIIEAYDEDENTSVSNSAVYYYKGTTVVKFNYNDSTKLFSDYVSSDSLTVSNTSGANSGTLSMYPDSNNPAELTYTNTYGVKVAYNSNNPFTATKVIDNPDGNGYWLIETSTSGYQNLTINLEQLSANNGPRDWGIAYSTDGVNYTYVENSNARAISNDASSEPVETYGNLALPSECDNQETLYIKVFINGGEAVNGTELEDVVKGNTGLNGFEINGIPVSYEIEFNTTLLESQDSDTGTIAVGNVDIYVNGTLKATTDENGSATVSLANGLESTIEFKGDSIATRTVVITADSTTESQSVALMAYDLNGDGYVNAKDFSIMVNDSQYSAYKDYFINFVNVRTSEFTY